MGSLLTGIWVMGNGLSHTLQVPHQSLKVGIVHTHLILYIVLY